jgi:hypothetical protein
MQLFEDDSNDDNVLRILIMLFDPSDICNYVKSYCSVHIICIFINIHVFVYLCI